MNLAEQLNAWLEIPIFNYALGFLVASLGFWAFDFIMRGDDDDD